ncbi:MAG: S8 family serine peptidase [Lachnospiraceae bacterium]|nr:S8 family serine peptidase [Lachnospiraceae bacterium]
MENGKIDTSLFLALTLPESLRNKATSLYTGYNAETRSWELFVKYHGNLGSKKEEIMFELEELTGGYGIVFIREDRITEFSRLEEVDYIEQPKRVWLTLNQGKAEICLNSLQTTAGVIDENTNFGSNVQGLYGEGVLVAIIDSSIDYAHPDFRNGDGSTRILSLWDQTIDSDTLNNEESEFFYQPPEGFTIGTVFTEEMINMALAQTSIQERRRIVPSVDISGHGTHVAGIACGNGRQSNGRYRGVAPLSNILVVKLGDLEGVSFPRTTRMMEGVEYAVRFAEERGMPVAINLSFGNSYGSHSGNDMVASYLDGIATRWKSSICTGTGNDGNTARHAEGILKKREEQEISMAIAVAESSVNVQLWKDYQDSFAVEIVSPNNQIIRLDNNENRVIIEKIGDCILAINYGTPSPFQLLQEIYMEWIPLETYIPSGIWKFRLIPGEIKAGRYDFWLPSGNYVQSATRFLKPSSNTTLTIPSTTNRFISVGAYNGNNGQIAAFSGRGYTRTNQIKPEIVAPGVDIMSASPNNSYAIRSGTSMAAPFVTGSAALLLEWGIIKGNNPYLYGENLKAHLIRGAEPLLNENVPSERQGWGTLCVADSLMT